MIKPTVGRKVWYFANDSDLRLQDQTNQPMDASIAYVHDNRLINISVADHNGVMHNRTHITLVQEDDVKPAPGSASFCGWPVYLQQQAAKTAT